ncbi:MAG: hypothetical protein QXS20_05820 [Candidatus Thorarchaeota archaeon]
MDCPEDLCARRTLRTAGTFQEIRDAWKRRLDAYFHQLNSLIEGGWYTVNDLSGIVRESRNAAHEALDGLAGDLSAELVHESSRLIQKYEKERSSLNGQIQDLKSMLNGVLSGEEDFFRRQNELLIAALMKIPEYQLLEVLRAHGKATYDELARAMAWKKPAVRKACSVLVSSGYAALEGTARARVVRFLSAPWFTQKHPSQDAAEPGLQTSLLSASHDM